MRIFKSAEIVNTGPAPLKVGRDIALASGYAGWTEVDGANAVIDASDTVTPNDTIGEASDVSSILDVGSGVFALAEIGCTLTDFVRMEMKGARIADKLREKHSRSMVEGDDAEPFEVPIELQIVQQERKELQSTRLLVGLVFIRDGLVQLGESIHSGLVVTKTWLASHGTEILKGLSESFSDLLSAVFSCATGVLNVAFGLVEFVKSHREEKSSRAITGRILSCFETEDKRIDLSVMASVGNDESNRLRKYIDDISKIELDGAQNASKLELSDIKDTYSNLAEIARSTKTTEIEECGRRKVFSVAHIVYGLVGIVIGILGFIGLVIPVVPAAVGVVWLGVGVYKIVAGVLKKRSEAIQSAAEWRVLGQFKESSLIDVERDFNGIGAVRKSRKVAAAILIEHLSGGKRESQERGKEVLAAERVSNYLERRNVGSTSSVSTEGLHMRRRTAVRFLLALGMSRQEVRGIKEAIAEGREGVAFARLERFMSRRHTNERAWLSHKV
ncbi:hypothetical protein [Paraburkholderia sp. RL17-373-BIF-A]|uniref:hypothetical protein n=1 Tax=Paraburkholderia sp. RL17-373-BIF-A TaxID=3031629 RepID=UPI0038BA32A8